MSNNSYKTILAIESSCDETAAAIVIGNGKSGAQVKSNIIASQIAIHAEFGGVFPDLAAKEHVKKIIPTIELALKEAGLWNGNAIDSLQNIDAIAVTNGPGLIGSLLIGVNAAASLALLSGKPLIKVNHWAGHLYSVFIEDEAPELPMLALTVSGGHSSLILIKNHFDFEIIGETVDDAAGEAFDKIARMLELGFPGGPMVSKAADEARSKELVLEHKFPRPKLNDKDFDFSFSGLKTAVLYALNSGKISLPADASQAAREAEESIVEVLVKKTIRAAQKFQPKSIALVGGVSANKFLRQELTAVVNSLSDKKPKLYLSDLAYSTDNAAMIGAAATFQLAQGKDILQDPEEIEAIASLRL